MKVEAFFAGAADFFTFFDTGFFAGDMAALPAGFFPDFLTGIGVSPVLVSNVATKGRS
jgi:hypothetical protein